MAVNPYKYLETQSLRNIAPRNRHSQINNSMYSFSLPMLEQEGVNTQLSSYFGTSNITQLMSNTTLNQIALAALALGVNGSSISSLYSLQEQLSQGYESELPVTNTQVSKAMSQYKAIGGLGTNSMNMARAIARNITQAYEGNAVTGNFDGQGLSLGYLQWNIGSGTLQPLLTEMAFGQASQQFDEIFSAKVTDTDGTQKTMAQVLKKVLGQSHNEQLAFFKSINNSKNQIVEPWRSAFNKLLKNSEFGLIQDKHATKYQNNATKIFNETGVNSVRGYALAFDIAVQNGSIKAKAKELIEGAMRGEKNLLTDPNNPRLTSNQRAVIEDLNKRLHNVQDDNQRKLYYTAAAVAITSNDRFAKDVWARKSEL